MSAYWSVTMIDENDPAPDFHLPGTDGKVVAEYRLRDALEDSIAVLAFYVFDFHPLCTEELCTIRDAGWFDLAPNVRVFGIGTDRVFSHRAFAGDYDLDFVLLSDSDGEVAEAYDVLYDEFNGHRRVAKRAVFVVDRSRTVQYAWATDDPQIQPDWQTVKTAVDAVRPPTNP